MKSRLLEIESLLPGVHTVERAPLGDSRGSFERIFCTCELTAWRERPIAQINRTTTAEKGTIRGLHFQHPPHAECKYVTCLAGAVFDVAVDLRADSRTFGHWYGIELTGENRKALVIPEGFAHGFQTLSDNVEMLYLHSEPYAPSFESGINALDHNLKIDWPLPPHLQSQRDKSLPLMAGFEGIVL